jgi:hypothetical protein
MVISKISKLLLFFSSLNRIGFAEMPDLNLKVTPVFGESKYSYALIHDFLESRIRDEIKVGGEFEYRRNFHS